MSKTPVNFTSHAAPLDVQLTHLLVDSNWILEEARRYLPEQLVGFHEQIVNQITLNKRAIATFFDGPPVVVIPHGEQKAGLPDKIIIHHRFNHETCQINTIVHTFDPTNEPLINPDLSVVERQQDSTGPPVKKVCPYCYDNPCLIDCPGN